MSSSKKRIKSNGKQYVKWFKHWRSGEIIRAEDYNIKGFPIGGGKRKK